MRNYLQNHPTAFDPDEVGILSDALDEAWEAICVIRRKAAGDSDAIRPPIPTEVGHPFRLKPATLVEPV